MNETLIVVKFPDGQLEYLSRNQCVVTARLSVLMTRYPKSDFMEEIRKYSDITPQSWGAFLTVITATVNQGSVEELGGHPGWSTGPAPEELR